MADKHANTPAGAPEAPASAPQEEARGLDGDAPAPQPAPAVQAGAEQAAEAAESGAEQAAEAADAGAASTESAAPRVDDAPPQDAEGDAVADEIASLAAKRDEYLELAQRTKADFENYRRRMAREVSAAEARGVGKLVRELLPALDNLGLALAAAEADDDRGAGAENLAEGVRLIQAELLAALGRMGIEPYSPAGERFDPTAHEAMAQYAVEGAEPGTIVEVYQQGYRHGDAVLRPARVVVAG